MGPFYTVKLRSLHKIIMAEKFADAVAYELHLQTAKKDEK